MLRDDKGILLDCWIVNSLESKNVLHLKFSRSCRQAWPFSLKHLLQRFSSCGCVGAKKEVWLHKMFASIFSWQQTSAVSSEISNVAAFFFIFKKNNGLLPLDVLNYLILTNSSMAMIDMEGNKFVR